MNIKLITVAVSAAILAACGGDDNDSGSVSQAESVTLSGRVIDGYLASADVFLDTNFNGTQDDGEPFTSTAFDGSYSLNIPTTLQGSLAAVPIIAAITPSTVDVGTEPPPSQEALEQALASGELEPMLPDGENLSVTLALPPLDQAKLTELFDSGEVTDISITPFTNQSFELIREYLESMHEALDSGELDDVSKAELISGMDAAITDAQKRVAMDVIDTAGLDLDLTEEEIIALVTGDYISNQGGAHAEVLEEAASDVLDDVIEQERLVKELEEERDVVDGEVVTVEHSTDSFIAYSPEGEKYQVDEVETETVIRDTETGAFRGDLIYVATVNYEGEDVVIDDFKDSFTVDAEGVYKLYWTEILDWDWDGEPNWEAVYYGLGTHKEEKSGSETTETLVYRLYEALLNDSSYETPQELATAVSSGDMSELQSIYDVTEVIVSDGLEVRKTIKEDTLDLNSLEPLITKNQERFESVTGEESRLTTFDWESDGSINEVYAWHNHLDGSVERSGGFNQYSGDWEYEFHYWEQYVNTEYPEGSLVSYESMGSKSLANDDGSQFLDGSGEPVVFNTWHEVNRNDSDGQLSNRYTKWEHVIPDGYSDDERFKEAVGQKYERFGANNDYALFPEYWGQFVEDLPAFVESAFEASSATDYSVYLQVVAESLTVMGRGIAGEQCFFNDVFGGDYSYQDFLDVVAANCSNVEIDSDLTPQDLVGHTMSRSWRGGTAVRSFFFDGYDSGSGVGTWSGMSWQPFEDNEYFYGTWEINDDGVLLLYSDYGTRHYMKVTGDDVGWQFISFYDEADPTQGEDSIWTGRWVWTDFGLPEYP